MKRVFVQSILFQQALAGRKNHDAVLEAIEVAILLNPTVGDLIQGTGGVRKFRAEDALRGKGKRGGFRVLYLDLPHVNRTHLLFMYDKGEADDLSQAGRKVIKELVLEIKEETK